MNKYNFVVQMTFGVLLFNLVCSLLIFNSFNNYSCWLKYSLSRWGLSALLLHMMRCLSKWSADINYFRGLQVCLIICKTSFINTLMLIFLQGGKRSINIDWLFMFCRGLIHQYNITLYYNLKCYIYNKLS